MLGLSELVSSLLIPTSLQNGSNSFEVYSPQLSDLSVLIFFFDLFSIKALNSLNLPNNSLLFFKKYIY